LQHLHVVVVVVIILIFTSYVNHNLENIMARHFMFRIPV